MKRLSREKLNQAAKRIGYTVSTASRETRMRYAGAPDYLDVSYEIMPIGNQWADAVKGYETLADVAEALDRIEIMKGC